MAESIALHTKLKPGTADEYADAHAHIPPELVAALKEAGVKNWRIWRSGLDLFHVVDVENYQAMRHALADHPANVPWQARMAELLAVQDDYSGEDAGIQKVWELP
ncbi:L-rhamnose mutarotase [Paenarthrobacter sp. OM7]|uniref:L-rhamnose mutarotase n=1 Tax=Paenarthrobacter sp. AMU7 TaxID=3162492 RepID=A0AB39YL78_9MICC|nr:L-rhamnose mutarotase [Paenarthrobacter sp. OM7]WGM20117.1 L-rhamnose mutarotase [Paenarthrobacter sp. OM7]